MGKKESVIGKLKEFKKGLSEDYPLERMIFFGSSAKGKMKRDSDIDLILVSSKFKGMNFIKRGACMYNYWKYHYPVDFLCYTPSEFNRMKKQVNIVSEAIREGKEI